METIEHLYLVHPFWVWMALGALLLATEVMTGSGYLLWPAAAAGITALLTGLRLGVAVEVLVFAVLTIAGIMVARRFWPNPFRVKSPDINDPHTRLVGHQGKAAGAFTAGHGRVFVDGKEWAAELEGGGDLEAGSQVTITGVLSGASLKVAAG